MLKELLKENEGFLIRFETFNEMKQVLEETFLSGAVVISATMAKHAGRKFCKEEIKIKHGQENALTRLAELLDKQNLGQISFLDVDFQNGSGWVTVKNSFETQKLPKVFDKPRCYFLSNFMAGFLSELFQKDITVTEEKCAGKGDEQCEFKFHT